MSGDSANEYLGRQDGIGNTSWYMTDRLGSVIGITNASGTATDTIVYDGFGNKTSESAPTVTGEIGFQGTPTDAATGWSGSGVYRGGEYDPVTGTWKRPDPSGLTAGPNPYEAMGNDATNATDPSGLVPEITSRVLVPSGIASQREATNIKTPDGDSGNVAVMWGIGWLSYNGDTLIRSPNTTPVPNGMAIRYVGGNNSWKKVRFLQFVGVKVSNDGILVPGQYNPAAEEWKREGPVANEKLKFDYTTNVNQPKMGIDSRDYNKSPYYIQSGSSGISINFAADDPYQRYTGLGSVTMLDSPGTTNLYLRREIERCLFEPGGNRAVSTIKAEVFFETFLVMDGKPFCQVSWAVTKKWTATPGWTPAQEHNAVCVDTAPPQIAGRPKITTGADMNVNLINSLRDQISKNANYPAEWRCLPPF